MALVPHERALVTRLKGKPFVLIGVNGDPDGEKQKVKQRIKNAPI
jgi:hypothetical protein